MTPEQRKWMEGVLKRAREEEELVDYSTAAGPFAELLAAAINLEASYSDPVGIDEEDIPEIQEMVMRLIEIWSGETRPIRPPQ